jgi:arsenical pump membrane protein
VSTALVERVGPVLLFLASATVLAGLVGAAGVFDSAAGAAARLARGRQGALLGLVALLATVTTVVLSLDTTAVLVTPVALALARRLGISPWPYAFATVWLAGTASLLLPVSNLTNLLAAPRLGGTAVAFAGASGPAWAVAVLATLLVLALTSRRELRGRYPVPARDAVADPVLFAGAVGAVALFAALLVVGLVAWAAAGVPAVLLAGLARARRADVRPLRLVPWPLVVGVGLLFAVVSALGPVGLDRLLQAAAGTGGGLRLAATAAVSGNLVDNLPAYLALERVTPPGHTLGLLVGVDAGTLLTPWGSLATLLWANAVRRAGLAVPWRAFALHGLVLVPAVLLLTAPLV